MGTHGWEWWVGAAAKLQSGFGQEFDGRVRQPLILNGKPTLEEFGQPQTSENVLISDSTLRSWKVSPTQTFSNFQEVLRFKDSISSFLSHRQTNIFSLSRPFKFPYKS